MDDGSLDLMRLARDLKKAGRTDLRKELYAGLNRSTKPLRLAAKANALNVLPQGGGLAKRVATASMSAKARGGRDPGVVIVARPNKKTGAEMDLNAIDRGTVRHPTYGHGPWVAQAVRAGWFSDAMEDGASLVRKELLKGVDNIIERLARG